MLLGLHQIMALAEQSDVLNRGFASESHLEIVVELEPVRRAAHFSVSHRPGTAPLVPLPDRALDGGGDVAIVFAGSFRLCARPVVRTNGSVCLWAAAAVRVGDRPRAAEAQPEGARSVLAAAAATHDPALLRCARLASEGVDAGVPRGRAPQPSATPKNLMLPVPLTAPSGYAKSAV